MPGRSQIEWTDATWNPTTGCTHVSAGCDRPGHMWIGTFGCRGLHHWVIVGSKSGIGAGAMDAGWARKADGRRSGYAGTS